MKSHTTNIVMGSMHATNVAVRQGIKVEKKTRKPATNIVTQVQESQHTPPT